MLKRVILKNFRYNLRNYLLFFLSNTVAVSLIFVFLGLKNNLGKNVTEEGTNYVLNTDFRFMRCAIMSDLGLRITVC